jgi:SAM-dependent methyltransferase
VALPEAGHHWVLMNVLTRTCLGVESSALEVLKAADCCPPAEVLGKFAGREFRASDIESFPFYRGLFADPAPYLRDVKEWASPETLDAAELLARFKDRYLLVDDEARYSAAFSPKASILDREHLGTFHQQLGQHLAVERHESPEDWWLRQKFTADLSGVKQNLYGAAQESNLRNYFGRRFGLGDSVVDLGCGPGFYSNLIAEAGASVLGVDPNENYIRLAQEKAEGDVRFITARVGAPHALDDVPTGSADYVFMSDALLFYFVPVLPDEKPDIDVLLADVRRILRPGGSFISVEPHSTFWLSSWLGDVERPFAIVTEYLHKSYGVTASLSRLVQAFAKGGFAVSWMEEFTPDPSFERVDPRAFHFASQFPLWQLLEFKLL